MKTETTNEALKEKKKRDAQRFFLLWLCRFLICYALVISVFLIYVFGIQGAKITYIGNVQNNYAKYLVKQSDVFVGYMVEFENLTNKTGAEYTDEEKAAIQSSLEKQNEFLNTLQKRSPDETNSDYLDLYQDMLQIFAFYIQGEIMIAEYCYAYTDNYTLENEYSDKAVSIEKYTMGKEMCNMMGNMVLNNYRYINDIRGTNYQSKYNIVEIGNSMSEAESNTSN